MSEWRFALWLHAIMQDLNSSSRAQTQSRAARSPILVSDRLAFSVPEFARLNGKSYTWGYRAVYRGDVKVITSAGRLLVPRSEVEKFLAQAAEYNPQGKPKTQSEEGGQAS
jgi:hypothetical protein